MPEPPAAGTVHVEADPAALANYVAQWLAGRIAASPHPFRIALSGGSSPKPLYRLLGAEPYRSQIAWDRVEFYWGDERFVPHDHPDSNFGMAKDLMLSHIAALNVFPMPTDTDPQDCADRYEALLKSRYGQKTLDPGKPFFDVNLLGIGEDGHTASLIPGQPVLEECARWVAPVMHGRSEVRLTLTYPAIESSRIVMFLATGTAKADVIARARSGDMTLPAARVAPHGELIWFLDRAAATAS